MEEVVRKIERLLVDSGRTAVDSGELAEMLLVELKTLDNISYERFATNYRDTSGDINTHPVEKRPASAAQYGLFDEEL
jgi:transcriptional regulator NrdR family protein